MRTLPLAIGLLGLWTMTTAGMCAHDAPPAKVITQEVRVPVAVPCDAKPSPRPGFPDTREALLEADAALKLQLLYAGRKARDGYIGELEAAIAACAAKPPS